MRRYVFVLAAACGLLFGGLVVFNWYIDPFSIWRFDQKKELAQGRYPRLTKAHWIRGYDATGLVIGNSHASGFSAETFAREFPDHRFYNGYFQAGQIYELSRYASHYRAVSKPRTILVSIGIFNFFDKERQEVDFSEKRLATRPDGSPNPLWWTHDLPSTMLSWSAVARSIKTVLEPPRTETARSGFLLCKAGSEGKMVRRIRSSAQAHYTDRLTSKPFLGRDGDTYWRQGIDKLLDVVAAGRTRVIAIIPPFHASLYVAIDRTGYFESYLEMIKAITESAARHPNVELFDFTGITKYHDDTTLEDSSRSAYWDDSDHFSCRLGDLMISLIQKRQVLDELFGVRLNKDNVAGHIEAIRKAFVQWKNTSPNAGAYASWLEPGTRISQRAP